MKIAVLGLGRMGQALAYRLQGGGHDLVVWNRSEGRADELVKSGATEAVSPRQAVADVEVAVSSLANDDAVRAVALGEDGVLEEMGDRPYVDASTISPSLSAELATNSLSFMALPILGAPQAVSDGEATYLAGGDPSVIEDVRPILDSLGGQVKRYERPDQASTAKLAVNLMLLSGLATLAEALTVGRTGGLSDDQLADLLGDSPMLAPGLKNRFDALIAGPGPTWWTTALAAKDARLVTEAARSQGKDLPLTSTVRDIYQTAADHGLDDEDIVAVAQLYR